MFVLAVQLWMVVVAVLFAISYLVAIPAYAIRQHVKLATKWKKHYLDLAGDNQRLEGKVETLETSLNHCMEILAKNQEVFRTVAHNINSSDLPTGVKIKLISELPIIKQEN